MQLTYTINIRHMNVFKLKSFFYLMLVPLFSVQAIERPRIWVDNSERSDVLKKIDQQAWAAQLFETMKAELDPYVARHEQDPDWILGRVQLTWGGPHYTRHSNKSGGKRLIGSGRARHPTVRFIEGKLPVSDAGNRVDLPTLEEVPSFNTHPTGGMKLVDRVTGKRVMVPYIDRYLRDINRRILELATDASVLFWLTQETRYAAFSADILSLFCEALEPMEVNPGHNWGLISNNHLLEARWFSNILPIIYDFVAPYIAEQRIYDAVAKKNRFFDHDCAQNVFLKYINLALNKGILNCNWVVFEASSLVNCALGLDDLNEQEKYMQYFFHKDTNNQQSMQTFMQFFTRDDYWFESLSYGNETINFLTYLFSIADRHYPQLNLLDTYPVLFDAIHVMPRFQFPNGEYVSFGDSHRQMHVDAYAYEMMNRLAVQKNNLREQQRCEGVLQQLILDGDYDRGAYESQRYVYTRPLKLLWFQPELVHPAVKLSHARSDTLSHAGLILQRNGHDPENGMMLWQGGAHHVHAHASGMDMELYGLGEVLGAEAGKSSYGTERHNQYYRLYAAHNTVIVNNASRGHGGWVDIGQETVQLVASEPAARSEAMSSECSFATTSFNNHFGANVRSAQQQRTMALIRTTPTSGYYLDVFRSKAHGNKQFHDYVYHNIGSELAILGDFELDLEVDWFGSDIGDKYRQPGTRWFKELGASELTFESVQALFTIELKSGLSHTAVWFPAGIERAYASVLAPPTLESPPPHNRMDTPTIVARHRGDAWSEPFEAVYEMYRAEKGGSVAAVSRLAAPSGLSIIKVDSETTAGIEQQTIFAADRADAIYNHEGLAFEGRFAVCSLVNDSVEYIYLGDAISVSFQGWHIAFDDGQPGAAEVRFNKEGQPIIKSSRNSITVKKL